MVIDARERMRDAGLELEASRHASTVEAQIAHLADAQRLILEALAQVATVAGIAPLAPPEPEEEDES
jgi:hypothetical protein